MNKFRANIAVLFPCAGQVCAILLLAMIANPAMADHAPESIADTTVVDSEALIDLVISDSDVVLIDARLPGDYLRGHIDGSVNLPNTETSCLTLDEIIPWPASPVVFYCNGESCLRSAESVRIAQACGYDTVYWFRGGFEEWVARGYPYLKK